MASLLEYYESGNAPHEALGRAARRLSQGGALYLGAGVGIEKQRKGDAETYSVTAGGKAQAFPGPLSAAIFAFTAAGSSTAADSPGGSTAVADPAAAARLRELKDEEAEAEADIRRYEARAARRAARPQSVWSPGARLDDDGWEVRRIDELKADLGRIRGERTKLLASGKVEEVEQARPGTNFTKIPPANVKRLKGIIAHYKGMAHPFSACVRDQVKHGLSQDHANRRCAVVKDLAMGTTKWRKGAKPAAKATEELVAGALGRLAVVEEMLGAAGMVQLVEGVEGAPPRIRALAEGVGNDLGLLSLAGHPLALAAFGLAEEFDPGQPRDFLGRWKDKIGGLAKPGDKFESHGVQVTRSGARGFRVSNVRGDLGKREDVFTKDPAEAARLVMGRSLASKDPVSLGGAKSYSSIADLPGNEGMAPKMKLPGSGGSRMDRAVAAQREADAAQREATKIRLNPKSTMAQQTAATKRVKDALDATKAIRAEGARPPAGHRTPEQGIAVRRERLAAARSAGEAERIAKFARDESFSADVAKAAQSQWAQLAQDADRRAAELKTGAVPAGAIVRGRKTYMPGDPDYERLSKIVGPPEKGSPAEKAMRGGTAPGADVVALPGARGRNRAGRERTPKEQQRHNAATRRAQGEAQDRSQRIQSRNVRQREADVLKAQIEKMGGKGTAVGIARALGYPAATVQTRLGEFPGFVNENGIWRVKGSTRVRESVAEAFGSSTTAMAGDKRPSAAGDARKRLEKMGKAPAKASRPSAPGAGAHDEGKHPRGRKGTPEGGRFVRSGSSGEDVRAVQHRVGASPDGKFGEKTRAQVIAFQRKHGLVADGLVGHQTAVALAGGDGKSAKPGDLKGSDRAKLAKLRKGGKSMRARRRAPDRRRGGRVV